MELVAAEVAGERVAAAGEVLHAAVGVMQQDEVERRTHLRAVALGDRAQEVDRGDDVVGDPPADVAQHREIAGGRAEQRFGIHPRVDAAEHHGPQLRHHLQRRIVAIAGVLLDELVDDGHVMYIHHMFAARLARECLGVRITRLQRLVTRRYSDALRPLGMTTAQLEILAELALRGRTAPTALAAALLVDKSTLSRNLALMDAWLIAERSPTGRAMAISLSPAGRAQLAAARAAWAKVQGRLVKQLGADAIATLDGWLTRLS